MTLLGLNPEFSIDLITTKLNRQFGKVWVFVFFRFLGRKVAVILH